MSQATVTQLISRLMSDAGFRSAVATTPTSALAGYDLTDAERAAFTRVDMSSFDGVASGLDERTNKGVPISCSGSA